MSTTTKPVNQKAWFLILPVIHLRGLLGHSSIDDSGELLGAGHHLARAPRVCGHRMVCRRDAR